ncbi:hypothetical protein DKT77_06990 [Meridianimarinicoccus roseus]|uniref:DUF3489 domain-containing protein n=1 Tax=Meridianimarinicoccus roseus TaxID=2072018 RepID=A0A2V2LM30_9RHOB|nr:hypothetical protein DKT77_06990 [Meridianimarinicoccus roseus]
MRKGELVWRETGDGHGVTLVATDAGLATIGIEQDTSAAPEPAPKTRTPREGTKQATLITMLRAPDGATIEEIMAATGWQSHTVRGAIAGALKKRLGLGVTSEKVEDAGGSTSSAKVLRSTESRQKKLAAVLQTTQNGISSSDTVGGVLSRRV